MFWTVLNVIVTWVIKTEQVNEAHFEFLSISELLVEMADDL